MSLATYEKASQFIPFSAKPNSEGITVWALDLDDISALVSDHLGAIANALEIYENLKQNVEVEGSLDRFAIAMIRLLPGLSGSIIAVSCGEPELSDKARQLAFGTQLRALSEITRMTLEDAGGIKNLFAALPNVLAGLQMPQTLAQARAARNEGSRQSSGTIGDVGETLHS